MNLKNLGGVVFCLLAVLSAGATESVWVKGAADELYAHYGFAAEFEVRKGESPVLRMSAASIARVWVNGEFAGYGPARAPEGYMRVDEWPLGRFVRDGRNVVAIEVSNPAANQFYLPKQSGFLWAEVLLRGKSVAETGRDFKARPLDRVRKVNRMSFQRAPAEFWRLDLASDAWRTDGVAGAGLELETRPPLKALDRGAPYPDFAFDGNFRPTVRTRFTRDASAPPKPIITVEKADEKGPLIGFAEKDLEVNLYEKIRTVRATTGESAAYPVRLLSGEGVAFRGDYMTAGFPRLEIACERPATVYLLMDDRAGKDGLPNPLRMGSFPDACGWQLEEPGNYTLECFEPYGFSAAHLIVDDGAVTVKSFAVRSYGNPEVKHASFACSDPAYGRIFESAKRSLAWNAVDCFTDCPGRERGIYFGDTTFTARGADVLLGDTRMERTMYLNYVLAERFPDVPKGQIPMCYPSDVTLDKPYWIPNFALWSVIQLEGYLARSGDRATVEAYRPKAEGILGWFRASRNADGLLENMPGWVFVEWSEAQKYVTGVSYVSNMIYVRFLDAMAALYGRTDCAEEADRLRGTLRAKSFNGEWFTDNQTGATSELCQYAAFMSRAATPQRDSVLWSRVVNDLGPARKPGAWPKVLPSNMLFGYSIRMVLLSEHGCSDKVLSDVRQCLLGMAEDTGTLWEGMDTDSSYSCCHGFPSMAAWLLARDALGLKRIDRVAKQVVIDLPRGVGLDWCEGTIPVSATESVTVGWKKTGEYPVATVAVPSGWTWRFATSVPTALPKDEQNPYWAGPDFWNRRHADKLKEIAAGPKDYDFVFVGDSITHNWEGWSDPVDVAKVTKAYEDGELKFPNGPGRKVYGEMKRDFRLLNLGVGGDATQHALWRLANGELDGYRTKGVMLMIGTNNNETPLEIAAGVRAILDAIAAKQPEARTILLPVFPCMRGRTDGWRKRNEAVNAIIRGFADGEKVVWCDFNASFLTSDGVLTEEMMPDLLHPLEKGYRIWREAVESTMREISFR